MVSLDMSVGFPSRVAVMFINLRSYLSVEKKEIKIRSSRLFRYPFSTVYFTPSK